MPTLTIRGVDQETYDRFRLAAKMRDMNQSEYLAALVALHDAMRQKVDSHLYNSASYEIMLSELGLETVEG